MRFCRGRLVFRLHVTGGVGIGNNSLIDRGRGGVFGGLSATGRDRLGGC